MFSDFQQPFLLLVIEGCVTWAPQVHKLLCTSLGKELRLLLVFCFGRDTFQATGRKLFMCASFLGLCIETCEAESPCAIRGKGIRILRQRGLSGVQCWAKHWDILCYLCFQYQWVCYELGRGLSSICGCNCLQTWSYTSLGRIWHGPLSWLHPRSVMRIWSWPICH